MASHTKQPQTDPAPTQKPSEAFRFHLITEQQPFTTTTRRLAPSSLHQHRDASLRHRVRGCPTGDVLRTWTVVARGLLVVAATAAFLTLLSAHVVEEAPTGFAVDGALFRKVRAIDYKSLLCWEELRRPFFVKTSLDMEVGENIQGTLVYSVPAFSLTSSSDSKERAAIPGWPKKRKGGARAPSSGDSKSAKTLDCASETPPPYSHTESQSIRDSRVNQIVSPLSADGSGSVPEIRTHARPVVLRTNNRSQAKVSTSVRLTPLQRLVRQGLSPAISLHGGQDAGSRLSEHVKVTFQNSSLRETTANPERRRRRGRRRRSKSGPETRHGKPKDLNERRKRDPGYVVLDHSPKAPSATIKKTLKGFRTPERNSSPTSQRNSSSTPERNSSSTSQRNSSSTSREESATTEGLLTKATRHLRFQGMLVTSHSWEPLAEDDDGNMFVYSAFYDGRPNVDRSAWGSPGKMRVLGMCARQPLKDWPQLRRQVFCHYRWNSNPDLHIVQRGRVSSVEDGLSTRYHAVFVLCDLHLCANPDYVGITLDRKVLPRSYLPVQYPPPAIGRDFRHHVTTCLPVMHSRFRDHVGLLQMLETDRLVGTEKFTLYVHSLSPEVAAIIRHYVTSGVMEAVEWRPPPFSDSGGEEEAETASSVVGQLMAANDCLYRAMYLSRHVVFHGLHESPVPRQHATWKHLLHELQRQERASWWDWWRRALGGTDYGSYTFQRTSSLENWIPPDQLKDITEVAAEDTLHPRSSSHSAMLPPPLVSPLSKNDQIRREKEMTDRKSDGAEGRNSGDQNENSMERKLREQSIHQHRTETENDMNKKDGREAKNGQRRKHQKNPIDVESNDGAQDGQRSNNRHAIVQSEPEPAVLILLGSKQTGKEEMGVPDRNENRKQQRLRQNKDGDSSRRGKEDPLSSGDTDKSSNDEKQVRSATGGVSSSNTASWSDGARQKSDRRILDIDQLQVIEKGMNSKRRGKDSNPKRARSETGAMFQAAIAQNMTLLRGLQRDYYLGQGSELQVTTMVEPHTVQAMGVHSVPVHVKGFTSTVLPAQVAGVRPHRTWGEGKGTAPMRIPKERWRILLPPS